MAGASRGALVDGQHDGQHAGEVGRCLEEDAALVEGLADELVLLVIQLHDRFLKVPNTAVDKLR